MPAFNLYAAYYDLLYRDKDYTNEARFIGSLIREWAPNARSLLEMGCGTGGHALSLADLNFEVHGFDLSQEMIQRALTRRELAAGTGQKLDFKVGDVRNYRAGLQFDAVISLFHVMSYQTRNSDLLAAFGTARAHLQPGGLLIFDFWYGPAVLSDRPRNVRKNVADSLIEVSRNTTSTMDVNHNCVDVRFDIDITSRDDAKQRSIFEVHRMRYLFLPEIEHFLDLCGFGLMAAREWMSTKSLSDKSWYACVVARAQ